MFQNSILRDEAVNPIWQESDGLLVVEANVVPLGGIHTKDSSFKGVWNEWAADTGMEGLINSSGYCWGGPDLQWNPGAGLLRYRLHIDHEGDYRLRIRNRHDSGKGDSCFVRVDGGQWWITRGGEAGEWTWTTVRETSPSTAEPFREHLERGFHQLEISGRLDGFCIERLVLALDGVDVEDAALAPSAYRPR